MFWVRKRETFVLHAQNLCSIEKTDITYYWGLYIFVYLPIIQTIDNSNY